MVLVTLVCGVVGATAALSASYTLGRRCGWMEAHTMAMQILETEAKKRGAVWQQSAGESVNQSSCQTGS
jgi:membrane protein DedA with SNARE-associated domain